MGRSLRSPRTVRFGLFEADLDQRLLTKAGVRIKLQDQPFELLVMLLERPGELITREEIRRRLWPADTFVAFDDGLNTAVKKLRAALADVADSPRFVETVPRRGYRFLAPVTPQGLPAAIDTIDEDAKSQSTELQAPAIPGNGSAVDIGASPINGHGSSATPSDTAATAPVSFRPGRLLWPALIIVALALLLPLILFVKPSLWKQPARAARSTIIVIPLDNLSGDPQQEYFSDGITEEITTQLARSDPERLGVIGRLTAMRYKGSHKDIAQIGREVPVQYVLEGSVRRDQTRFRVTVQLIEVAHQTHVWAEEYDRDLGDSLQLQRDIATAIAAHIDLKLTAEQQRKLAGGAPIAAEAHDAYLKGRYEWNKRTEDGFRSAVKFFQQALQIQPDYAQAYAGLADSYNLLGQYRFARQSEAYLEAKVYAQKALRLDSTNAEAWTALADVEIKADNDWVSGEHDFLRAIQLDSNYATAHLWYAEDYLAFAGRVDEALAEVKKAQQIEPLSPMVGTVVAETFYVARDYDKAIQQAKNVLEMEPGFVPALVRLGEAYEQKGMFPEAIAAFKNGVEISHGSFAYGMNIELAYAYAVSGKQPESRKILSQLLAASRSQYAQPCGIALIYTGLGEKESALAWLERCGEVENLPNLRVDPKFDPLRREARFQNLLKRTGPN